MRFQTFRTKPKIRNGAAHRSLQTVGAGYDTDHRDLYEERTWRCLVVDGPPQTDADILISRCVDPRSFRRCEKAVSPSDRYIIGVALKTTRLKFTRGPHTIFDGIMRAGTLHVTGPSQLLSAEFYAPCDFIHFHVSSDYLRQRQDAEGVGLTQPSSDLNDLIIRDPLAELLGRTLVESSNTRDGLYAESVGQTLVMHIARMELSQPTASALPKWRLKRVQEYVNAHLDEALSLADLAAVAGLSRMYFAGQFRAATGYRPHDYLLYQRIESAKSMLSSTDMPLAEVALSVGFQAQAHFSTVFKRLTGQSPARWRRAIRSERQFPDAFVYSREDSDSSIQDGVANQFRPGVCAAPEIGVIEATTEGHTHTRAAVKATQLSSQP
jgi:AraC family transcriptional regulator